MRSYRAEELFDDYGRLVEHLRARRRAAERRMSGNPHTNGGLLLRDLAMPDFRRYAAEVSTARRHRARAHPCVLGELRARHHRRQPRPPSG